MNSFLKTIKKRSGQSLAEVMIGLAIGAILIGAASFVITSMLRTNASTQKTQFAGGLAQELVERIKGYASSDWQNIYNLSKGASSTYFFITTSTQFMAVPGVEGVVENDITNGLVAKWGFDETSGSITYDESGNKNNSSVVGGLSFASSTLCKLGNCGVFNGTNSYVSAQNTSTLQIANDLTVMLWVYPTNVALGRQSLVFKAYNNEFELILEPSGWLSFYQGDGTWEEIIEPTNNVLQNKWTHIAVTRTVADKKINFYFNGVLLGTSGYSRTVVAGSNPVLIGSRGGSSIFSGKIDDVRIYNRALSSLEVKQLYASNIYSRSFYVQDACRTNDSSSVFSGVSPCLSGSIDDPSSQKVVSSVSWGTGLGVGQVVLSDVLTRWKNAVFQQTDWSGGVSGNILINSGNTYSSSSGVNSASGSLRIQGL